MGPVSNSIYKLFNEVVHGNIPKYAHWNIPV
jgi:hypothetical protein